MDYDTAEPPQIVAEQPPQVSADASEPAVGQFEGRKILERELVRRTLLPRKDEIYARYRTLALISVSDTEMTSDQLAEFELLQWQLDRLGDAEEGEWLDVLEHHVDQQVEIAHLVGSFVEAIKRDFPKATKRRAGKRR